MLPTILTASSIIATMTAVEGEKNCGREAPGR
jgi:hypothetical protein